MQDLIRSSIKKRFIIKKTHHPVNTVSDHKLTRYQVIYILG